MKRVTSAAVVAATVFALSGCGEMSNNEPSDEATAQPTAADDAPDAVAGEVGHPEDGYPLPDQVALELFYEVGFFAGMAPAAVADISESVCRVYDSEPDTHLATIALIKELTDVGLPGEDAGATIVYATGWKCPEHYGKSNLLD